MAARNLSRCLRRERRLRIPLKMTRGRGRPRHTKKIISTRLRARCGTSCRKSAPRSRTSSTSDRKTANSSKDDPRPGAAPPHEEDNLNAPPRAVRHKLQEERASITHKFNIRSEDCEFL